MALWFDTENQEQKLLNYMPKGKAYAQSKVKGSNFNNLILWISASFKSLVDKYNQSFKGLYLCVSDYLIENWRLDYSVPNSIFYFSELENRTDLFVLKYLMRGNTEWNFKAIASAYGIKVLVKNGVEHYEDPLKTNILVITFEGEDADRLPHDVPHFLGSGRQLAKIQKIYETIKEAHCKIIYEYNPIVEFEEIELCSEIKA